MGEPIAEKKWTSEQKQEIENSRINTTKFMMKTLKDLRINPKVIINGSAIGCLLYTSPSPRDRTRSRMPSSA